MLGLFVAAAGIAGGGLLPGCSGCGNKAPLTLVPVDAVAVVVVPSIQGAVRHAKQLTDKFGQGLLTAALLDRQSAAIEAELGFDPRKPHTMKKVGIDPERGLVVSFGQRDEAAIVVGAADEAALNKYLRSQLQKVGAGGATFKDKTVSGVKLTSVAFQGNDDVAAWTYVNKNLLIGGSKAGGAAAFVARLATQKRSIEDNPTFGAVNKRVGQCDVMLYVDGQAAKGAFKIRTDRALDTASDWMKRYIRERKQTSDAALAYFDGLGLGLRVDERLVALTGYYAAPSARAKVLRTIFSGVGESVPFGKFIGPDALVVLRASFNARVALEKALEILPSSRKRRIYEQLERMERDNNLSLDKDVLAQLGGRFAAALYAPRAEQLRSPPQGGAAIARATTSALLVQVRDDKKVAELLRRLERFLVMRGLDIRPRSEGDRKVYSLQDDGAEVASWTVTKNLLVLATGGRLAPTLALIDKGGDNVLDQLQSKRAKRVLKDDEGALLNANMSKIADAARALDLGMEFKVMLAPVFGTLGKFKDVTFSVELADEGLVGALEVSLN